ncbi:MAG: hypothetical protein WCV84_04195 [Patescibacteria group bacterium]
MIKFTSIRFNGQRTEISRTETADRALDVLVACDLGWSAQILMVTPELIRTRTSAWPGCWDEGVYEGPEEEMEFLVRVVREYLEIGRIDYGPSLNHGTLMPTDLIGRTLVGELIARSALLSALNITDEEEVRFVMSGSHKASDVVAAALLAQEMPGTKIRELLA